MRKNIVSMFWGFVLIIAGVVFLAYNFNYLSFVSTPMWAAIFGGLSILFFISYFLNGVRQWGWLFPALIFAALAVLMFMIDRADPSPFWGTLILAAIGIPFLVAFLLDVRTNWWALIPAWVLGVLSVIVFLSDQIMGEVIGAIVLFSIGLPFLVVFVANRKNWWALIPGIILLFLGFVPLLSTIVVGEWIGALVLGGIGLPFLVVYLVNRSQWWAVIPAGVLLSLALTLLVLGLGELHPALSGLPFGIFMLGLSGTFAILWLVRDNQPTEWAKYPSIVLGLLGLASIILGVGSDYIWPILIIVAGILFLYFGLRQRKPKVEIESSTQE